MVDSNVSIVYRSSTSLYLILLLFTMALLHSIYSSTLATLPLLYATQLWVHDSTLLSIMALLHSTWFYCFLQRHYFTLYDPTLLYHGSTSVCLTLLLHWIYFTLLHSIWLYITLPTPYFFLLYIIVLWLYFTLLDITAFYNWPTSLHMTLH